MTHQFREDGRHFNGGAEFFGYGYRAIGEPRLAMVRRWYRQGERRGQAEDRFFVDGAPVESYAAAVQALTLPIVFTPQEADTLALATDDFAPRPDGADFEVIMALREKGAVELRPGKQWRRTRPSEASDAQTAGGGQT